MCFKIIWNMLLNNNDSQMLPKYQRPAFVFNSYSPNQNWYCQNSCVSTAYFYYISWTFKKKKKVP